MQSIKEDIKSFYLGLSKDEPFIYRSKDLTTHAVIIGMTGSGKTGLGITLLEEACIDNIPTIIIDPKGDMTNLLLAFNDLSPSEFLPYVDDNEAKNAELSPLEYAQSEAKKWQDGLKRTYQEKSRIKLFKDSCDFTIFTPKSSAGVEVALLGEFKAADLDDEALIEYVSTLTSSLLSLLEMGADSTSNEFLLICSIFMDKFKQGVNVSLSELIELIANPPFDKLGVFDLKSFYPQNERLKLAMRLNSLLASPSFIPWQNGEKLDIKNMLFNSQGRARCNIFTIAHLSDSERMFFVTILLNEIISFMRQSEGSSSLKMVLYMDEIFGFFPPNQNPSSKTPMLTLLKQARAFGIGVVLSTQNPVDIDYKGLSNIGTWFIGRLQTAQDKARVIDGLSTLKGASKEELEHSISNLQKRNFLVKNINKDSIDEITTRWALSYLKGPLNKEQISNLMADKKAKKESKILHENTPNPQTTTLPMLSDKIIQLFNVKSKGVLEPYLLANAKVRFNDSKKGIDFTKDLSLILYLDERLKSLDFSKAYEDDGCYNEQRPDGCQYCKLPSIILSAKTLMDFSREFKDYIYRDYKLKIFSAAGIFSKANESKESFYVRLASRCDEIANDEIGALSSKFEKEKSRLESKLDQAILKLEKENNELKKSGIDAAINIGTSIIAAIFGAKKVISSSNASRLARGARSANRILKERIDVKNIEDSIEDIELEISKLNEEYKEQIIAIKSKNDIRNIQISEILLSPKRTDIYGENLAILWQN